MADQEPSGQDSPAAHKPANVPLTLSASALKAFAHPLRQAMHQYLVDRGPATATILANAFDESTGQTSYHLRQLAKHGMIVESDSHQSKGKERWWEPVGLRADGSNIEDAEALRSLRSIAAAQVRSHAEFMMNWLGSMTPELLANAKGIELNRTTATLTPEESEAMIKEVMAVVDDHTDRAKLRRESEDVPDARRMRIYLDVVPLDLDAKS